MATRFPDSGGKIDGRRISIIALLRGIPLSCRENLFTDVYMYIGWPGLVHGARVLANSVSIAEVRKRYCSEIETVQIEGYRPEIPIVLLGNPA